MTINASLWHANALDAPVMYLLGEFFVFFNPLVFSAMVANPYLISYYYLISILQREIIIVVNWNPPFPLYYLLPYHNLTWRIKKKRKKEAKIELWSYCSMWYEIRLDITKLLLCVTLLLLVQIIRIFFFLKVSK
jgi:hypothetical protein